MAQDPFYYFSDKFSDPGYPYFYRARPVKRPYILRNPIIGKALAGDFMFPYRIVQRVKAAFYKPSGDTYKIMINSAREKGSINRTQPAYVPQRPNTSGYGRRPDFVDLRHKIEIYFWNPPVGRQARLSADLQENLRKLYGDPYMRLDFIPSELEFQVPSQLKDLGIIGRNYPVYHYTGSEETLTIKLSWYDFGNDSDSVVAKCRKLEALSKADGYNRPPRLIYINWGDQHWRVKEGSLLKNHIYVVQSANYTLSQFVLRRQLDALNSLALQTGAWQNGMYPLVATQDVVLKRVAGQLTQHQISYGTLR